MLRLSNPGLTSGQAAELEEIENHLHNVERWLGAAVTPSGETHVADRIGTTTTPFIMDGGSNTWGDWLQILGSADTPVTAGKVAFDLHRIQITTVERSNATHFVQIGLGDSGAAALAAGTYTEFVFRPQTVQGRATPVSIIDEHKSVGVKAWARVWVVSQDTGEVNFWIGLHEYDE